MLLKIAVNDAQALLEYLIKKPYAEVHQLVNILRTLEPHNDKPAVQVVPAPSDDQEATSKG